MNNVEIAMRNKVDQQCLTLRLLSVVHLPFFLLLVELIVLVVLFRMTGYLHSSVISRPLDGLDSMGLKKTHAIFIEFIWHSTSMFISH